MADTLRIKRRVTGLQGAPGSLANAELAYNEVDHVLYYGEGTGGAGGTASVIVGIGGNGMGQSATNPLPNATSASTGSSALWSRSDHVHGTDTSRAPTASPTFTGLVSVNGTIGGAGMTLWAASPPAIGSTSPAAGTFTTLTITTSLAGSGFSTYLASPPAIGGTTPNAGSFTTLSATGAVSGAGFTSLFASPPPIGAVTASTAIFTNLSATGTVSGAGFTALLAGYATIGSVPIINTVTTPLMDGTAAIGTLQTYARPDHVHPTDNTLAPRAGPSFTGVVTVGGTITGAGMTLFMASPPAIGNTAPSSGAFTTLSATGAISGTGINNLFASPPAIGSTTAASGSFTTLSVSGAVSGVGFTSLLASPPSIGSTAANTGAFTALTASGAVSGAGFTTLLAPYALTANVPVPSSVLPVVNIGTGVIGSSLSYARGDHAHPIDTSRAPVASPTFTGTVTMPNAANGTIGFTTPFPNSTTALATTAFVSINFAPINSPTFTGVPLSTTPANGDSTTKIATTAFVLGTRVDQQAVPLADTSWNNFRITSLGPPSGDTDAATKRYVDQNATGLSAKTAAVAATTANLVTFPPVGPLTIDGYTTSNTTGDRVLVKDQTLTANNGIWVAGGTGIAWARASDMDAWTEVPQAYVFIINGTVNANSSWVCTSVLTGGTLGTTPITWVQFSQQATLAAGSGLTRIGNIFDAVGTVNRILINADNIDIAPTYVGQTSITTLGTISGTAVWSATDIAVSAGGTGVSTLAAGYVKSNGTSPFTSIASIPNADVAGLQGMALQVPSNVAITGGTIDNITFDMGTF